MKTKNVQTHFVFAKTALAAIIALARLKAHAVVANFIVPRLKPRHYFVLIYYSN